MDCQEAGNYYGLMHACGKIKLKVLKLLIYSMVHTCVVPGYHDRSNKPNCKGVKFYTLSTTKKVLQLWLSLTGRRLSEVSFHSRICSEHFINGKKTKDSIPEIFPRQRHSAITTITNTGPNSASASSPQVASQDMCTSSAQASRAPTLSPADIVRHDHSYCTPLSSYPVSTHLTPITATEPSVLLSSSIVHNSSQTTHAHSPFFSNYCRLIMCYEFLGTPIHYLKYWGSKPKASSVENRGASRALTPLNEFCLVLCRLRCGLMEADLAFRFQMSQTTVPRIIITWINFIYARFKDIPLWPSKQ